MMKTFNPMPVVLTWFLLNPTALVYSQGSTNTSSVDPSSIVSSVCSASGANGSPACELFNACRSLNNCDPLGFALAYCRSIPASSNYTSLCGALNARCAASPNDCRLVSFLETLPSAVNVSSYVNSICTEMPMMANCNKCPSPDPTTRISSCPVFRNYADLCIEMPGMGQCAAWRSFCSTINNRTNFCNASEPAPSATGTGNTSASGTPSPSPSNTRNGGSRIQLAASFLSVVSILPFILYL